MSQETLAAVLHGAQDLRMTKRPVLAPENDQVQIAVKATGLCGSDLHYFLHGKNGEYVLRDPMILGHESAGVVTAVGSNVSDLKVGDRVAIEAGVNCQQCRFCESSNYNLCTNMRFASSAKVYPHADGTLQSLFNHPARLTHKLPDVVSFEQASLVEPLSVVLHASERAKIGAGQSVIVFGAGAVGLLGGAVSHALGASKVVIVDINQDRVDFALTQGFADAGHVLPLTPRPETAALGLEASKSTAQKLVQEYTNEEGFDVVLECTGVESCMQISCHAARTGGKVVFIGMGTPNPTLPISATVFREVDIMGVFRYCNTYPTALKLFAENKLPNVDKLVTHRFPLEKAVEAFKVLQKGKDDEGRFVIKLMVGE